MKKAKVQWPLSGRLEEIDWYDHMGGSGWASPDYYEKDELSLCRSVGYVLSENVTRVTLMQNLSSGTNKVDHSMVIAKKLIVRRRVLRRRGR